jgi:hypothetical protein
MRIDRDTFLLLAGALAACHADALPGPRPAPTATASSAASSGSVAAPASASTSAAIATSATPGPSASTAVAGALGYVAPPRTPADGSKTCKDLLAGNLQAIERATGSCPKSVAGVAVRGGVKEARASAVSAQQDGNFPCRSGVGGTWGVSIRDLSFMAPSTEGGLICAWKSRGELVYEPPSGARVTKPLGELLGSHSVASVQFEAIFDFDGDGRSELVTWPFPGNHGSCGAEGKLLVLQATAKGIADYPVGFHADRMADADADGRPDLLDDHYFTAPDPGGGLCGDAVVQGPPVLIHSLPGGTFTRDDVVTRGYARARCPSKPAVVHDDVPCARIWGATEAEVLDSATRAFAVLPKDERDSRMSVVAAFAKIAPPFRPLSIDPPPPLPKRDEY